MRKPPKEGATGKDAEEIKKDIWGDEKLTGWEEESLLPLLGIKSGRPLQRAALDVHLVGVLKHAVDTLADSSDRNAMTLRDSIDRLVDSSNSNTRTMACLQKKVVWLTWAYVVLTAALAVAAVMQVYTLFWRVRS